jgi:hypothetical protein
MTSARAPGTVHLLMDGERIESIAFDEKTEGAIAFGDMAARLHADGRARKVEVEMEEGAEMPYAIQVGSIPCFICRYSWKMKSRWWSSCFGCKRLHGKRAARQKVT